MKYLSIFILFCVCLSCKKGEENIDQAETPPEAKLIFKFHFDSTQVRLGNLGNPVSVPTGHGAQSPHFNSMSAHYIELAPDSFSLLGSGDILYRAPEVTTGGSLAIDFSQAVTAADGDVFFSVPMSQVTAGTYHWLRISLAYQNYDINYRFTNNSVPYDASGTIASYIGYNSYIQNNKIKDSTITVNANKLQGYWAFESTVLGVTSVSQGQAPPGATTVPNPLSFTSPIPAGSCVVTGKFNSPLVIPSSATADMTVVVSVSTNKSFEWVEHSDPDYFEPLDGDTVIDMGVRGIEPYLE